MKAFLTSSGHRVTLIAVAVLLSLSAALVALKLIVITALQGDSAIFFQATENVAERGKLTSTLYAHIWAFLQSGITRMSAAQIAAAPLRVPAHGDPNLLRLHAYFILYPLGLLSKFIPVEVVLQSAFVLAFTGLLASVFALLVRRGVFWPAAGMFVLLVAMQPAWSESLLYGQFYPDRLFVLAGFLLLVLAARAKAGRMSLLAVALVCAAINERGALVGGAVLILYTLLNRGRVADPRFKLVLGVGMCVFGEVMIKFVLTNDAYSQYLPTSFAQLVSILSRPGMSADLGMFALVNVLLLAVACFEWRAALIAFAVMIPNMIGTIGGAEKTGWITHYHSFYFPVLVWAAMNGFTRLYRIAGSKGTLRSFYIGLPMVILLFGTIRPYGGTPPFSFAHLSKTFVPAFIADVRSYLNPGGLAVTHLGTLVANAVPEGASVTTPEGQMPFLYSKRQVYFLPMGIDSVDYAVLSVYGRTGNKIDYGGIINFGGPAQTAAVNAAVLARMRRDGYDFAHPVFVPGLSVAILRRVPR